jgi:anti-sigma factor RsiW
MKCSEIRELMPDLAAGLSAATPGLDEHLRSCPQCAGKMEDLQKTMALLDEWQAPEPSPYFDVRLQARLREEMAHPTRGWLHWIRMPAFALALTVLVAVGVTLLRTNNGVSDNQTAVVAQPGTAVGDLQALDRNHDLYADFDLLDDLQVQEEVTANP